MNLLSIGAEIAAEEIVKKVFNAINANQWKNLFVKNGEFFRKNYVENEVPFQESLRKVFSKEMMEKLSENLRNTDGYSFCDQLKDELSRLMKNYEIPAEVTDGYIQYFLEIILQDIKINVPELYEKCHFEEAYQRIVALLQHQNAVLINSRKSSEYSPIVYSINDIDNYLKKSSKNHFGLEFFIIDDKQFRKSFQKSIHESRVYVKGKCREESTYCILNELLRLQDTRPISVIKTKKDWDDYSNRVKGHILIPMFYDDEIVAPVGNTTIFVYGEMEPCTGNKVIELRPRMLITIRNALREAGFVEKQIEKLIRDTHGLYIPMKKYLFYGRFPNCPAWSTELDERVKRTALLVGRWNERSKGDREVIERLSGIPYENFLRALMPYMKGEDPFVIKTKWDWGDSYCLASIEDAWELIDAREDRILFRTFLVEFQRIISTPEKWFSYSHTELISAQLRNEEPFWSKAIRQGMLRSLNIWLNYKKYSNYRGEIESIIKSVLSETKTVDQWKNISMFFTELCEIAPDVILDKIEKEIELRLGLFDLLNEPRTDYVFGRDDGIHIITGLETLLVQERFVYRTSCVFAKLDNLISGDGSKQLEDVFKKILCPWYTFSAADTPEKKVVLATALLEVDIHMWDHIFNCLPYHHMTIIGNLQEPLYREHNEPGSVTNAVMFQTTAEYIKLLLSNMDHNPERWKKALNLSWEFSNTGREEVFCCFKEELSVMGDDGRLKIKEDIRKEISKHRFFTDASWAVEESVIQEYETIMEGISFQHPEYEFVVFFVENIRDYLLQPTPYHEKDYFEKNEELGNAIVKKAVCDFQEREYNLRFLAGLCAAHHNVNRLGRALAEYWQPDTFQDTIMDALYSVQSTAQMATDYVENCAKKDASFIPSVLNTMLNRNGYYSDGFISSLYYIDAKYTKSRMPLIQNADEFFKRLFWKRNFIILPNDRVKWALSECKQYGTAESFINLLNYAYQEVTLSEEELFNFLDGVDCMDLSGVNDSTGFCLGELLKPVQQSLIDNASDSKIIRIAQIEMVFYSVLGWEKMNCFRHNIQKYAEIYLEMVSYLFYEDDRNEGEKIKPENEQLISNIYNLFEIARFCPGERKGDVQETDIRLWVDGFRKGLMKINRSRLFGYLLGRVLANSPVGKDGYEPCEAVRSVIEQYADESLISSYRTSIYNKRGVYTVTAGEAELDIAQSYKQNADALRIKYPHTATIYDGLYETYKNESKREREEAEYE